MFVPPFNLSELSVDSTGHLAGGTITALQTQFNTMLANPLIADVPLYLLHDTNKAGTLPPPDPISSFTVESQVGTQRRRLRN